jgi:hypothetical protein
MAWSFGDSFDLYTAVGDALSFWDSITTNIFNLVAGRFAGSRAIQLINANVVMWFKNSGANDAVHHIVVAYQTGMTITGSNLYTSLQLGDGATPQCSIVFRSDGAILLQSGVAGGTTLATYTGAFVAINTWYAFEFEVVINNTTGSFAVRKNGNPVNDFTATALNTRGGTANNYANRLSIAQGAGAATVQLLDDLFWQSGAATGAWLGDIRCYARMPASDQGVQFSRAPVTQSPFVAASSLGSNAAWSFYMPFVAKVGGTVGAASVTLNAGFTGNLKCSVFNNNAGVVGTVLSSATTLVNPVTGVNAITFPTPFTVVAGTQYWLGFIADGTYALAFSVAGSGGQLNNSISYASFPVANPATSANQPIICSWTIAPNASFSLVNDAQQDALTSYVYDSTPGDADFYGVGSIASTPVAVIATTTRAYMQKSDAGARTAAVQLKSGVTTVASPTLVLTTSGFQWAWRTDLTDPNTGAAWTPAAVNNAQIGPVTIA